MLLLLDRLKDQQIYFAKFTKVKECIFLLDRLKDQHAYFTKLVKAKYMPIPTRSSKGPADKSYKIR